MPTEMPPCPLPHVIEFITRYVHLASEDQALILGLWTLHTWTFSESMPNPRTTPYLYVHSPEKQSGKTRLIEVLEVLVRNPMRATDMSPSVLFRAIETMTPTILLDEVDAIWSGSRNEELRGTLNGGYKVGGHVWRTESLEPRKFGTFAPKLLAGIDNGLLPDTIRDRSIPITLHRKPKDVTVSPFYSFDIEDEVEAILSEIETWVRAHAERLTRSRPAPMTEISDRAWEIAMPLVAIAAVAECEDQTRAAIAELLHPSDFTLAPGAQLLSDIRDLFGDRDRLPTSEIIEALGKDWNGKLLGNKLRPYEISAGSIRVNNVICKGYYRRNFETAWERYL
jgi:hypothetical protein